MSKVKTAGQGRFHHSSQLITCSDAQGDEDLHQLDNCRSEAVWHTSLMRTDELIMCSDASDEPG